VLANEDKHRLLHVVSSTPEGIAFSDPRGRQLWVEVRVGLFDDQTEIAKIVFENPLETDTEIDGSFVFDLAFASIGGRKLYLVRNTLVDLFNETDRVIRNFDSSDFCVGHDGRI
jgi:hypothetical protein